MFRTLTGERSWQRLRRSAVDLHPKSEKLLFEPTFMALRGNVRTPSMARWKARGRLYIRRNWTFRSLLQLRRYERKSVEVGIFRRGGSLWAQISEWRGRCPPTTLGICVAQWLPFCVIKISAVRHLVLSQCTRVTDRRTDRRSDRQNYDSQDQPRICSRGKKHTNYWVTV